MRTRTVLLLVLAALAALAAGSAAWWWTGRDDGDRAAVALAARERYCPLSALADEGLTAAGVDGPPEALAPEAFFARVGADVPRLAQDAPEDVRADVATVVDALRAARRGDADAVGSTAFRRARAQLVAFHQAHCLGEESGTG